MRAVIRCDSPFALYAATQTIEYLPRLMRVSSVIVIDSGGRVIAWANDSRA